jgi:gas vesicle protein
MKQKTSEKSTNDGKTSADVVEIIGNKTITDIIKETASLWKGGENNRLQLGEKFSLLYREVARYKRSARTNLTYAGAVARTTVPRGTAERYRQMWEVKQEFSIPADVFLSLCEEGANLAAIKAKLGESFKGAVGILLPRIRALDITDAAKVADLAKDVIGLIPDSPENEDLAELDSRLSDLMADLAKTEGDQPRADIAESIHETREQIRVLYIERMKPLVTALAPFLGWSDERVKEKLKAFEQQRTPELARLHTEATKLAKAAEDALAIITEAAA